MDAGGKFLTASFFALLSASFLALENAIAQSENQSGISVCGAQSNAPTAFSNYHAASPALTKIFDMLKRALGEESIELKLYASPDVEFASAINNFNGSGPAIVYNPIFLKVVYNRNPFAVHGILAHEFGHFISPDGRDCSLIRRELAADRVVGCVFSVLGRSKGEAKSYIWDGLTVLPEGKKYAVPRELRDRAVDAGFVECRNSQLGKREKRQ